MSDGVLGRIERGIEREREALRRLERLGDRAAQPSVISNIGFWLASTGRRAEAEPFLRRGLQAAVELGARADEAYAHMSLSWMLEQYGDLGPGLRECDLALGLARRIGHREWTASGLASAGRIARICGAPARARDLHEEMLATARELGTALWIAGALGELGEDLVALGELDRSEACLHEAIATAREAVEFTLIARLALADLRLAQRRPAEALETAEDAEREAGDYRAWRLEAARLGAEACRALGRAAEAETRLGDVEAEARACGFRPVLWRAALARAELLAARGLDDEARALRVEMRTALERVAADLPPDLRASFAAGPLLGRARSA
jgi:tetratricopeptide (TPR) repeat protein